MGLWLKQDGELVPVSGGSTGEDGRGWTGGTYDAATGTVTFTSDDGLEFTTGDLRGTDGIDGLDGNMWHVGSGAPGASIGDPGDYYLDGEAGWVWVKRTDTSWTNLYVNLTGPPGADGDGGGSHDHDYLPLSGGTVTGDLTVDGNTLAKINIPADAWGVSDGTVFVTNGMVAGTQGSYGTAMTSNGYRNTGGNWTSLARNGSKGAVSIELLPTGTFYVRASSNWPTGSASAPTARLQVTDTGARVYNDLQVDGQTKAQNGTAAAPAYSFTSDPDTGIYRVGSNSLGFATAAKRVLQIGTTHANFGPETGTGTASIKVNGVGDKTQAAYGFRGDLSTGMYRSGAGEVTFTSGGTNAFKYNANYFAHPATGGARLKRGVGTIAEPAFGFFGDPDTGIWRPADNNIEIVAKGARAAYFGAEGTAAKGVYLPGVRFNETAVYKANTTIMGLPGGGLFHTLMTRRLMTATEPVASYAFERLFDLKPLFFRSLGEHDDKTKSHYGLAAEDVAEIDPRLATWGEDRDGNVVPENVDHDAMIALLVASAKRQRDQIAELTARLDKVEERGGD